MLALGISRRYLLFACSKLCTLTAMAAGGQNLSSSICIKYKVSLARVSVVYCSILLTLGGVERYGT